MNLVVAVTLSYVVAAGVVAVVVVVVVAVALIVMQPILDSMVAEAATDPMAEDNVGQTHYSLSMEKLLLAAGGDVPRRRRRWVAKACVHMFGQQKKEPILHFARFCWCLMFPGDSEEFERRLGQDS